MIYINVLTECQYFIDQDSIRPSKTQQNSFIVDQAILSESKLNEICASQSPFQNKGERE